MSTASWYPDPTGRFAQRYFDGERWTSHVADRDGTQSQDPTPVDPAIPAPGTAPAPPPPAPPPPAAGPPPQPGASYSPPAAGVPSPSAAATSGSTTVGPGLILSAVGVVLTLVAMFALDWMSEGPFSVDRSEISDLVDAFSGFGEINALAEAFFNFGWVIVLLAAVAALAVPFVPGLKVPVAIVCFIGAAWVLFAVVDIGDGIDNLAIGAYLGIGGPALAAVGALISSPPRP